MFRFETPEYLYLLLLLPMLAAAHYLWMMRRARNLKRYGDPVLLRPLMRDVSRLRTEIKVWLLLCSLGCLIVALARPQYGTRVETRKRNGIEAIIAMDISNSMLAEDVRPNRLEKAKMLVSNLVDNMTDDKIGLIVYAGQAYVQLPITSDYVSAKMFLETISPSLIEMQGTDIAAAIDLAAKSFTGQQGVAHAIFVITDGEDNEGGAVEAARAAAERGIHVYVLGVGEPAGAPVPVPGTGRYIVDNEGNTVMSRLSEDMCREIANAGRGNYIYVDNSSSAQKKLDKYVENLGRTEMESTVFSEYDEQFQSFLILALFFLLLDICILERENHILQRFTFFSKRLAILLCLCSWGAGMAEAQTVRDYVRRGNRLMTDTVGGKDLSEKAVVQYKKALEMDSTVSIARYNYANALIRQNNAEEAMKEYAKAAQYTKDKQQLSDIYHNMGVLRQAAKQYDKAVACYMESLRNDPSNDETRYNYVLAKWQLKNQQGEGQDNQQQDKQDQQQQQQQQEKKEQEQQQQQQEQPQDKQEMPRETAERLLQAAMRNEKETQEKIQQQQKEAPRRRLQKQW